MEVVQALLADGVTAGAQGLDPGRRGQFLDVGQQARVSTCPMPATTRCGFAVHTRPVWTARRTTVVSGRNRRLCSLFVTSETVFEICRVAGLEWSLSLL
ncbi:hypothetical protein GCM10009759_69320 [Kitasatospora saccharophila]|uniref:Uncharacterized protein n=1 Tax=Kitasatospora saccharophila TaxID=407973 RepID=A0ABP5JNG3_9ACTN